MHCCVSCCIHRHDPAPALRKSSPTVGCGETTDRRVDVSSRLTRQGQLDSSSLDPFSPSLTVTGFFSNPFVLPLALLL